MKTNYDGTVSRVAQLSGNCRAFAEGCMNGNTIDQLATPVGTRADRTDCKTWEISPAEWFVAVRAARHDMIHSK